MQTSGIDADVFTAELKLQLNGAVHTVDWPSDRSLVSVLIDANLSPPHSCLVGKCGACVCTLLDGQVAMASNEVLDIEDLAENFILGCQARPLTPSVEITFD